MTPAGTVLVNNVLTVGGGGSQAAAVTHPAVISRQARGTPSSYSRINVINRASLTVGAGASINQTSLIACDGTGAVAFPLMSTLQPARAALNVTGCRLTLGGNVSYVGSMVLSNASRVTLEASLRGSTAGGARMQGALVVGSLQLRGGSTVSGEVLCGMVGGCLNVVG
jgi:hypothetical protein